MGYSCAAVSSFVLDALSEALRGSESGSNTIVRIGGFWEIGRENANGAITGTCWKNAGCQTCSRCDPNARRCLYCDGKGVQNLIHRAGSFKIDADGKIVRFPGSTAAERKAAEQAGGLRYKETFCGTHTA